jgi:hypothetical protein
MRHTLEVILAIIGTLAGLGVAYFAPGPKKLVQQTFWLGIGVAAIAGFLLVTVW